MKNALGMFVVLMVALAMTGVAVAHWSDTVQIEGTVYMGDFIVGWRNIVDNRGENDEIASLKCTLEDPETSVHHTPAVTVYHTLKVEIDNAYPEYWARCWVNLKNAGTIPATIVEYKMTPGPGLEIGENLYMPWVPPSPYSFQGWRLDNADTKKPVMVVKLVDDSGLKMNPAPK